MTLNQKTENHRRVPAQQSDLDFGSPQTASTRRHKRWLAQGMTAYPMAGK
jgi:hypothetical protein